MDAGNNDGPLQVIYDVQLSVNIRRQQIFRQRSEAGLGLVASLISLMSDEKSTIARFLLERMVRRLLDRIYSGKDLSDAPDHLAWLAFPALPQQQQKTWASFAIQTLVRIIHFYKTIFFVSR